MPLDLSRRSFLFGAAATVAVVAVGRGTTIIPQPVIWPDEWRAVFDIMMGCTNPLEGRDIPFEVSVLRDNTTFLQYGMSSRMAFRWVAPPDSEIIIPKGSRMRIDIDPCVDGMEAVLITRSLNDDRLRSEHYRWQNDMLAFTEITDMQPPPDLDDGDLDDEPPRKHVMWPGPIAWLMGRR